MLRIRASSAPSEQLSLPQNDELARLREEFRSRHCVLLPGLLDRDLAETMADRIESADFYRREHEGIGVEDCMSPNAALAWLLLLVNDNRMRDAVRSITRCGPIGSFDGRVYRLEPSMDHHDSWHTDLGEDRLVALSINLGRSPYGGGALEIRDRRAGSSAQARNAQLGDGLLFELGEHLEHRVLPIYGANARTVFAGWFKGGEQRTFAIPAGGSTVPREATSEARSDRLLPADAVVARWVGDDLVLVHLDRGNIFTLNATGARAWELLGEGRSLESVEVALADEFEVERAALRAELDSLVSGLEEEQLLVKA